MKRLKLNPMKNPKIKEKKMSDELQYGDYYIMVNRGDIFAGNWDQLTDCFGIDAKTIEGWCYDNDYTYTIGLYKPADKLDNELHRLYKYLRQPNVLDSIGSSEYEGGIDEAFNHIADKLKVTIESFERDNY